MNLKTELVALVVRQLQNNNVIARPDTLSDVFATFATGKTQDVRTAESVIEVSDKLAKAFCNRPRRGVHKITTAI